MSAFRVTLAFVFVGTCLVTEWAQPFPKTQAAKGDIGIGVSEPIGLVCSSIGSAATMGH